MYSHGYGFVQYECAQDAARAITELDKIPVEHKKLKVAYSKPNGNAKNFNLYVSGLPPDATETTLKSLFEKCGWLFLIYIGFITQFSVSNN